MRTRTIVFSLSVAMAAIATLGLAQTTAQGQDEDVRGAFLTTRPKPAEKSSATARRSRRRPKTTEAKATTTTDTQILGTKANAGAKTDGAVAGKSTAQKIGLGLTLFTRDSNGLSVRADPTRVFHSGDRVRVLLETNADGYLYIFNTTDGGKPVMIYPNPELDEGGNYLQSHVPFEIPSGAAEEERLRWLSFDKDAGAERLFLVFTREALAAVPTEDDLINYCRQKENKCPIQPDAQLWSQIQTGLSAPLQIARVERYGKAQTAAEHDASTRGLGLSKEDPEPSLVMMTASGNTSMLVTLLELIHK